MKTEIVTTLLREKVTAIVRGIAADSLRKTADALEGITAANHWPFPTYGDLLFGII